MKTLALLLKKVLLAGISLGIISLLTFAVFQILPGNPVDVILGVDADPLQAAAMERQLGLDQPLAERYIRWATGMLHGDMGESLRYQLPVRDMISQCLPVTLSLTLLSLTITLLLVVPISVFTAKHNGSRLSTALSAVLQLGISIPSFWLAIMLILVFAVWLGWLPSSDFIPFSESLTGALRSLILPAVAVSTSTTAVVIRYLKNTLLDEMHMDYVRTARSKGLPVNRVLYRHVLKNALVPTVTILGMMAVDMLGGSIIVENVFNIPGVGSLVISAVNHRDFPLVQGMVVYLALTVVIINLLVDVVYTLIDPRMRG